MIGDGGAEARVADRADLPALDGALDGAVCFRPIRHTDYAGVRWALSEILRAIRPGGEAYVTFNAKDSPSFAREYPVLVGRAKEGYSPRVSG
jgi:hypothetical protein